jgi:hypothetical protein
VFNVGTLLPDVRKSQQIGDEEGDFCRHHNLKKLGEVK